MKETQKTIEKCENPRVVIYGVRERGRRNEKFKRKSEIGLCMNIHWGLH